MHVAPNAYPWTDDHNDGAYADLTDYVEYGGKLAPLDFILVDGRARVDCLAKAHEWIANDGIVVLHDAQRPHYQQALKPYASQVMFTHRGPGTKGLWVGSKRELVEGRLNVARHK